LTKSELDNELKKLNQAAAKLRGLSSQEKNDILLELAQLLQQKSQALLNANAEDLKNLSPETPTYFKDRLTLTQERIQSMTESLRQVVELPDPVGVVKDQRTLANGLQVKRIQSPLGVLFMIFEARPNVITEAFSLAFKSGNGILLRGGKESKLTAQVLYSSLNEVFAKRSISPSPFWALQDYDRQWVNYLLKQKDKIDVVIPRGGEQLIQMVQQESLIPLIKNDRGLCHVFIDESADLEMALQITINAKTQRPSVCNSIETVLIHERIKTRFLPALQRAALACKLELKLSPTKAEFSTEYLDLILNVKTVASFDEALEHIAEYGSKHSECIVTASESNATRFQSEVDAAVVYWNASTRFTDGFELGLGGELGISTQKLHVRGPVSLQELTSLRWVIRGQGQVRA
jgi:glutamate-5-semialdehyde dehydrogenase